MTLWKKILFQAAFSLLVFFVFRLTLFVLYFKGFFDGLTFFQVVTAFFVGIKFDLSIASVFLGIPLVMQMLPHRLFLRPSWQSFWQWIYFALTVGIIFFLSGDVVYFGTVKRHVFDELLAMGEDFGFFWHILLASYWHLLLLFLSFIAVLGLAWRRFVLAPIKPNRWPLGSFATVMILLVLCIRGSFSLKPIGIVDAFVSEDSRQGQLVLNGFFSAMHAMRTAQNTKYNFYDPEKLKSIALRENIDLSREFPFYGPFKPQFRKAGSGKINVVVFILESWGSFYLDSFGGKGFGATPYFDRLASEGLRFTRFFSHGSRSIEGIQATLSSFPVLKGLPPLGDGLESLGVTKIGHVLQQAGYDTYFLQSAPRRSFRLDSVAGALGFGHYFGAEDYPRVLDYGKAEFPQFGWDYDALHYLSGRLHDHEKPFFAVFYSGTTHAPFVLPPRFLKREGHGNENETGFLNTLYYADWSVGEFVERSKKEPWFDNTVFIFTADHAYPAFRSFDFLGRYEIPLLIYAPKLIKNGVSERVGSHLDILPTAFDLAGLRENTAFFGHSLMSRTNHSAFAIISGRFDHPCIITSEGYLRHSLAKRMETLAFDRVCGSLCFDTLEERLLGLHQIVFELSKTGRWVPPNPDGTP